MAGKTCLRVLAGLATTCIFALFLVSCSGSDSDNGARKLVLLQTTDEHSFLLGVGPEFDDYSSSRSTRQSHLTGGIARRKTLLDRERAAAASAGASTLTVSTGDNMMGTLFQTTGSKLALDYRAMKALGYDVGCFGNHDFELGPKYISDTIATATANGGMFPIVSTNIRFSGTMGGGDASLEAMFDETGRDATKPVHRRLVITAGNGLRVGFIGIMGLGAEAYAPSSAPAHFSRNATQLYADVQDAVDRLRTTDKVDLVVLLGHTGTDTTDPANIQGESVAIAEHTKGVDVILSGHTHQIVPHFTKKGLDGRPVVIQEAGHYGDHLGKLTLVVARDGTVTVDESQNATAMIPVDDSLAADGSLRSYVELAVSELEQAKEWPGATRSLLERTLSAITGSVLSHTSFSSGGMYFYPLGRSDFALPLGEIRTETGMMRLITDGMLAAARERYPASRTDVAIVAKGIVRDGIWYGKRDDIAFADIFRVLPLLQSFNPVSGAYHTPGSPLVRCAVTANDLKTLLESAATLSYLSTDYSDYFTFPSGLRFTYDTSLAPFTRVTKITLASDPYADVYNGATIYDVTQGGWLVDQSNTFFVIVSDYYLAQFFGQLGVTMLNPDNTSAVLTADQAIMTRSDGSEYKNYEALSRYIITACGANAAKPGYLPARYSESSVKRVIRVN